MLVQWGNYEKSQSVKWFKMKINDVFVMHLVVDIKPKNAYSPSNKQLQNYMY